MLCRRTSYKDGNRYVFPLTPLPIPLIWHFDNSLLTCWIGVHIICRMASDLRNCQRTEFEKKTGGMSKWCGLRKGSYYEAAYKVRVLIGTDLQFEMFMNDRIRSELLTISWDALGDANST